MYQGLFKRNFFHNCLIIIAYFFFINNMQGQLPCNLSGTSGESVGAGINEIICNTQNLTLGETGK